MSITNSLIYIFWTVFPSSRFSFVNRKNTALPAWTRQWQIWQGEFIMGVSEVCLRRLSLPSGFHICHCQPRFYQKWENPFYMLTYPELPCTDSQQRERRSFAQSSVPITDEGLWVLSSNKPTATIKCRHTHPCTSLCLKVKLWDPYHVLSLIQLYMKAHSFSDYLIYNDLIYLRKYVMASASA